MRVLIAALATILLAACSGSAKRPATPGPAPTSSASSEAPPACVKPGEGKFLSTSTNIVLLGRGTRGVVVGAQANGDLCQTIDFARTLVAEGYHVAVFDWATPPFADSMAAAIHALLDDGATRVVVGGFSRGALVGLGSAPTLGPAVVGVFSVSGGPSIREGYGTIEELSRFTGPILLIASEDDPVFPKGTDAAIAAAHKGKTTLLMVPGNLHALALFQGSDGPRIQAAIDSFLAATLQ